MTDEREISFLDTNILVYGFGKSDSSKKRVATRLLTELMNDDRLRLSTQILQELFVTLTRKVRARCSSREALEILEDLTAWPVMVVNYPAIQAAVGLAEGARFLFGMHLWLWPHPAAALACCTPKL